MPTFLSFASYLLDHTLADITIIPTRLLCVSPGFGSLVTVSKMVRRKQPAERGKAPSKKGDSFFFSLTPLLHFLFCSNPEFSFTFGQWLHRFLLLLDSFSRSLWNTCSEQSSRLQGTENPAELLPAGNSQFQSQRCNITASCQTKQDGGRALYYLIQTDPCQNPEEGFCVGGTGK